MTSFPPKSWLLQAVPCQVIFLAPSFGFTPWIPSKAPFLSGTAHNPLSGDGPHTQVLPRQPNRTPNCSHAPPLTGLHAPAPMSM